MKNLITRQPLVFSVLVILVLEVFVLAGFFFSKASGVPLVALDLPLLMLNALLAIVILSVLGWWREAGFNAPTQWQNVHLLLVPLVLLIGPTLLFQPQLPAPGNIIVLLIVTLLIGFQEEAIFRGVLLHALRPQGVMNAVLISAGLFGIIHINSLLVGRDPIFVLAQIIASFLGAIGLGALRIRLNSVVPLVLLHAFNDFLQFSATGGMEAGEVALYIPILKVVISGLMALYGVYLLRGYREDIDPNRVNHCHYRQQGETS
ncbi:MAG TPA: CPBP family intramembrane metalloprotease [Chloroflexus aurantiacus]|uniref:Abortive infection protein n=1 Tax=Chloroflexus aurantiacus (strain ATCC 29366 / DSM 635 / J-10-fl) TaxID=324602 RepID=A9WHL4_CHLAA|nr:MULTISPECIES: CPBP family intramembrane glutamic endopeptidase [Chloroflexus]ABY36340.1 Abortive infection protein [Chloroflexus aurantiacus J-10-fl]RMG46719.1 MAG: CPBP family intramembrane metalloprotease [Chloroflexota bacterium]HBW65956.1 CPBP family intramembrane metalloprotease [Chloroflexus aurantiacus]